MATQVVEGLDLPKEIRFEAVPKKICRLCRYKANYHNRKRERYIQSNTEADITVEEQEGPQIRRRIPNKELDYVEYDGSANYVKILGNKIEPLDSPSYYFANKPAAPVVYIPPPGVDKETQIPRFDWNLHDFDLEVEPVLQSLVGRCLEQSRIELIEEWEEIEYAKRRVGFLPHLRNSSRSNATRNS